MDWRKNATVQQINNAVSDKAAEEAGRAMLKDQSADGVDPLQTYWEKVLEAVRARAGGWLSGVSASLGLSFATVAISTPGEGVAAYDILPKGILTALVLVALVLGGLSLNFLLKAAHGPDWLDVITARLAPSTEKSRTRAIAATADLRRGKACWLLSVIMFVVAVGYTWWL